MFDVSQIGRVNAAQVGEHSPETLLVVAPGCVKKRPRGWNLFEAPEGGWKRVVNEAGDPPFLPVEVTTADLAGVTVDEEEGEAEPVVVGAN